ncbi:MAG: outer membrane beta-barrel protein [Rhodomicrobium sp.]
MNGGWGSSSQSSNLSGLGIDTLESVFAPYSQNHNMDGGFGGVQIGYNWQWGGSFKDVPSNWLFGIEADIQGAGIKGSTATSFSADSDDSNAASASSRLDWFGTLRGRLGYTASNALLYGTGGLAFGGVKNTLKVSGADGSDCVVGLNSAACSASSTVNSETTKTGYVLGGGIEYLFSPRWSVKAEYQYINLGTVTQTASAIYTDTSDLNLPEGTSGAHRVSEQFNTVRIGLNYHVGGYEPLK